MKRILFLSMLSLTAASVSAHTEFPVDEATRMSSIKTQKEVSIHDPSIVYNPADDDFYVVGSHIGFARTSDMIDMSSLGNSNFYKNGLNKEFKSCPEHTVKVIRNGELTTGILKSTDAAAFCATYSGIKVGTREPTTETGWLSGNQWAPDIIYNPYMGKWCVYLSLNGDNWASVIVMLTSDSPKGPFSYEAPIVFGGFNGQSYSGKSVNYKDTDIEIVLGEQDALPSRYKTNRWGDLWPNCIDPCVFFDTEDNLWMAYGSWSGGIFMLRLDRDTGLRDYTYTYQSQTYSGKGTSGYSYTGYTSDPYFGKLIAGGAYVSGEGPYIQKIGDYYYLFVTYGGLDPDGGYEMRVFRSATPDGEYKDATGASAKYTQYILNYGPSAGTNKGQKILGSMNNWGNMTTGECAEGHNSAIVDKEGDAFVVYHTKFNNGSYGHEVRIRQLFTNRNGWIVASPFRYTGKQTRQKDIDSCQLFTTDEISGTYSLLVHPYRLNHKNLAEATPVKVILHKDGTVTGDRTGNWRYCEDGKSYVTLSVGGVTYEGVVLAQNVDGYVDMPAICMSAVSQSGIPVWLYKHTPKASLALAYQKIVKEYIGGDKTMIGSDAPHIDNVEVTFTALNAATGEPEPETLSSEGIYSITEDGHELIISVEMRCGDLVLSAGPFTRATKGENYVATNIYYPESSRKDMTSGWWSNFSKEDYVIGQGESMSFHFFNYSDATENWHNWALYGANCTHGGSGYKEYFGVRCDNWDNTTGSNTGCSSNFNWDTFKSDMNGSKVDMTVEYLASGIFTMTAEITTSGNKHYRYNYTKQLSGSPDNVTLFFVSEKSYIDGSGIDDVAAIEDDRQEFIKGTYNLSGIPVDDSYHGIVIRNGKKIIMKK
ncbi:MAG: glycoside hydrolase family 43 protein [Muribaculum sp.]|nr:glycoside hydrolase family 43 protein [Muribaculum sp.]